MHLTWTLNIWIKFVFLPHQRRIFCEEIVCDTETSTFQRWSPNFITMLCFITCEKDRFNGHTNKACGPTKAIDRSNLKFCIYKPIKNTTCIESHFVIQHSAVGMGMSKELLHVVSVPAMNSWKLTRRYCTLKTKPIILLSFRTIKSLIVPQHVINLHSCLS